jgi:subtilase family serine protease
MRPSRRTILVATASTAALALAVVPALTSSPASAASSPNRQTPRSIVQNTHPSWAVRAAEVASAPASKPVSARVYLMSRNPAALDRAVSAVSTPGSPSYRHYITPSQFRATYGPVPAAVAKVTAWLRAAGLHVSAPQQNGRYVNVAGSVKEAQGAFGSSLSLYHRDGGTYQAPASTLTVPTDVSAYVLTVTGLDEAPALASPKATVGLLPSQYTAQIQQKVPAEVFPPGFRNSKPCSSYYGQLKANFEADFATPLPTFMGRTRPYAVCGYNPGQLRSAYGAPSDLTGKGVTVAIVDAYQSPTLASDANRYAKNNGVAPFANNQLVSLKPKGSFTDRDACDAAGWSGEQSLDVEALHGFAPGAKVIYAAGRSCSIIDLYDAEVRVVDDNRASIVSASYGTTEDTETSGEAAVETYLFKQAAMQGIGFYIASGDNGDEVADTGVKQADASATDPYATAVGGSSIGIGQSGNDIFESGWGTQLYWESSNGKGWESPTFYGGGGGGFSNLFNRPSYQSGIVPVGSPAGRGVPDVAMDADPTTGMKIGLTQQFPDGTYYDEYRAGGTSLAAPLFAGVQALASQAQHARMGFANPRIYALARLSTKAPADGKTFRDITNAYDGVANVRADFADGISAASGLVYTVRTFDDDTSLNTAKGWDEVTGVGSPTTPYYTATGLQT